MAKHKGTAGKTLIGKSVFNLFFGSNREFSASTKGMRGERLLGRELQKLPEGWRVWHDLDIGGENIDHLVASAKGVFVVEVKNYRGKVLSLPNALYTHHNKKPNTQVTSQVWRQVSKLKPVLNGVYITPLLVFVNGVEAGGGHAGVPKTKKIACLELPQLVPCLRGGKNVLSYAEAKELFDTLDRLTK